MDVFGLRDRLVRDYDEYIRSFVRIRDQRIRDHVDKKLRAGLLWPDPLIQLNPAFEPGEWIDDLAQQGVLHGECKRIFRRNKSQASPNGEALRLHRHQSDAVRAARTGANYVLTTGTGSGKSLAYIIPVVDRVLRNGSGRGIQAIVVYPMNALANSQFGELKKFLCEGYSDGKGPVTFERYTGQEKDEERQAIIANPPDILLTNYVMLELILTRPYEKQLIEAAQGLKFLVLDELHTYRGRQGADVALLVRRLRDRLRAEKMQCVGTSATVAGAGSANEQRAQVASVASKLFGAPVAPENVICESLRRVTPAHPADDPTLVSRLRERVVDRSVRPPATFDEIVADPLATWIETTFGVAEESGSGRLIRAKPMSITGAAGAAASLGQVIGVDPVRCAEVIQETLLAGFHIGHLETSFPVFAFRVHQFFSRGDTVYASVEPEDRRHITVQGQQFVPGDRDRVLLPLAFCRECGQEYFVVRRVEANGAVTFEPREISDRFNDDHSTAGFLHFSTDFPWPDDLSQAIEESRIPDDWLEPTRAGGVRMVSSQRRFLPEKVTVSTQGRETGDGLRGHFVPAPFRFCLRCGVSYGGRQSSDFAKLASLGAGGRSTATTIMALSAIRQLRQEAMLAERARKLLSFTDNRQDASLQVGHFNDFVDVGILRSALFKAALAAGPEGLRDDHLTQAVFDALALDIALYATDPTVRFQALEETKRALRDVLGYRLYHDLRRGWRITSPNLEQCGLLEIRYASIDEVCRAEDVWQGKHEALVTASPETRMAVAKVLLDHMRRELAIKVDYLSGEHQERIRRLSTQRLRSPWCIDDDERMETAAVLYPRSQRPGDWRGHVFLSPRGGFGHFLRRSSTFPALRHRLGLDETQTICAQLLEALRVAGLVQVVEEPREVGDVPGYQVPASGLRWVAGDGARSFHDPIRMPNLPEEGGRPNSFFVDFYRSVAFGLQGVEAHEHTGQVDDEKRVEREGLFREGKLPVLFCSPTMELGVDIAELNVVNLRNVPPTPANYAQRSGRAGRSGQPALVFAYCSTGNSHDQYHFRRPTLMVSGSVTPPRLELANEDLVRSHVQAVWLSETGQSLGKSLTDVLDVAGDAPTLELTQAVKDSISAEAPRARALGRAHRVIADLADDLADSDWYSEGWLEEVLTQAPRMFDRACDRWRGLYRAALNQFAAMNRIIADAAQTQEERDKALRLRREAESQLALLREVQRVSQSDFYSYRYFASEGFLPGYSFPRLPLSAFIPARRRKQGRDEFLSRPRFLAITEFGPRSIVYHEGSRYIINRVIMPVDEDGALTRSAKRCQRCGYIHPAPGGADRCERCGSELDLPMTSLFRLQNVVTKRRDRITSDEEERLRLGFELKTGVRFSERGGQASHRTATVAIGGQTALTMTYGQAATLWRINLGWRRRQDPNQLGFVLDLERGFWARNQQLDEDEDPDDPMSARTARVIPYVEDRKNCLLVEPAERLGAKEMSSLQYALKNAIQVVFNLEDSELAAEALPSSDERRIILLYESTEGGAGVLRRLIDDPDALGRVAREALDICHFDSETGDDKRRGPHATEDCEAACYDCLMSYTNQTEHALLDRKSIRDLLLQLRDAEVEGSPASLPRAEHLAQLMRLAGSELEREWLRLLEEHNLRLPSHAQQLHAACHTRPDFFCAQHQAAIYIDGPPHDYPERQRRDAEATERMEDAGITVIRFHHAADWLGIIQQHPNIFGREP